MDQKKRGALPFNLKRKNYLSILNIFRTNKALSANDISYQTGISRATVMKAINSFMRKGLVESAGKGDSTEIGGKKPELFQFCMKRYLLCIGLWSTEMVVSLYDLTNTLMAQQTAEYNMKDDVHTFLDTIQQVSESLLKQVDGGSGLLYGVSLCLGGYLDEEAGVLKYSILTPEWGRNIPLKQLLADRFPNTEITVDNVARMSACAAVLDNQKYLEKRVATIYTDVGVSACYINRGHVEHGRHSLIGEIGLMAMAVPNAEAYETTAPALFSTLVNDNTICGEILKNKERLQNSMMYQYRDGLKIEHVFKAANDGDPFAGEVVRETAWLFTAALNNMVVNFDPDYVIMQGTYSRAGEWFDSCLREGLECFGRMTSAAGPEIINDQRSLISLQMSGMTKVMSRKFFSSEEWL